MEELKERICNIYNLNRAFKKCKSNRMWKPSVMDYFLHMNKYNYILHKRLMTDSYIVKPCYNFVIHEPKRREIQAPYLTDRIVQSSVCNNFLKDKLRFTFIRENCACQEGKGTDDARNLFKQLLARYARRHGTNGVVWKLDLKNFFGSIDGNCLHELNVKYIQEPWTINFIEQWGVPQSSKGLGLGAETNQAESCLALHPIDTFLKTVAGCHYMVRYQDDIMIILKDKQVALKLQAQLIDQLEKLKLKLNTKKTQIYKLSSWYPFLGFRFTVTKTSKVLMKIKSESIRKQKRRALHQSKVISAKEIQISKTCWIAHASKGNNYFITKETEAYIMDIVRQKREAEKQLESAQAKVENLIAKLEYVAMMSDVDLPEENKENAV